MAAPKPRRPITSLLQAPPLPYVIACALAAIYLVIILPPVAAVLTDMDLGEFILIGYTADAP